MVEGPGADSEEKHEPVSDIDTAAADSLKVLDLKRPIREADIFEPLLGARPGLLSTLGCSLDDDVSPRALDDGHDLRPLGRSAAAAAVEKVEYAGLDLSIVRWTPPNSDGP